MAADVGRRDVLKGAGVVTALAAGVTVAGAGFAAPAQAAAEAAPSADVEGIVTATTTVPSVVEVRASEGTGAGTASKVRTALLHRTLRPGDRVITEADPATGEILTSPLFQSLDGPIVRLTPDELVVGGVTCKIDDKSVCYLSGGGQRKLLGLLRNSPHVRKNAQVGILAVDNEADHTLTVQALYLTQ